MVFEAKKFNGIIRFNIRQLENKMTANMAEILYSHAYISSSMTAKDPILVSTLWFSRSRNATTSSDLTLDDLKNKMAVNMAKIWYSNGYISSSSFNFI